ncbi:hypothetical protein [Anaerosporobacter sp.]|uniref:hypothetical protein n=1 Tax=Anaerosporobacter sp. TaxID=1872529 RepID=UPI00286ED5CB|nr:hypothetical protein [Anaerosporobacter sp.]
MANLTEKELSSMNDLLNGEEQLVKKFQMLAESTTDQELKDTFSSISQKHQNHFNSIYSKLQ